MSEQSRRNILKSIALGGGIVTAGKVLPDGWKKPVVDTVILPSHAATTACVPCLDAATYCASEGEGAPQIGVAVDGTVTVFFPGFGGSGTDTVDPCTGGSYEIVVPAPQGNVIVVQQGSITVTGSIPCGVTDTIQATFDDGQAGSELITLYKDRCVVD